MWKELGWTIWQQHRKAFIGAIIGLFFGFIYLITGFWSMLIFASIFGLCLYVGVRLDQQKPLFIHIRQWVARLFDRWTY